MDDPSRAARQERAWRLVPDAHGVVAGAAALVGLRLGLRPISDNSTLVHLRTGIDLVRSGHLPRSDPYSFTAPGHPWVVQSWLVSLLYGLAEAVGHHALLVEQGVIMGAVAGIIAVCARSSTGWRTALAATVAIAASAPGWSPRPLMFELGCLALTILVVERKAHPAWLVAVAWVWVNTHGSYPVGLAWLAARAFGEAIDARGWPRVTGARAAGFVAGLAVALLNPIGWRLLSFPVIALRRRATFAAIVEWRSPNFQDPNTALALVFIAIALVILLRAALPWRHLLPVSGFLVLGLLAVRNLAPFGVTLAPALGAALAGTVPGATALGRRQPGAGAPASAPPRWRVVAAASLPLVGVACLVVAVRQPELDLSGYPVAAVDHLDRTGRLGAMHRVAATDVVGCFLIWRGGGRAKVFIDDRYDMYPRTVVDDARVLADGRGSARAVLDRRGVDTVVWDRAGALPAELLAGGGWRQDYGDTRWVVLVRDQAGPG